MTRQNSSSGVGPSMKQLSNQSTIYRRHERRLQRTYALRDDPRSAPVRVLSGLPGMAAFFPPYTPHGHPAKEVNRKVKTEVENIKGSELHRKMPIDVIRDDNTRIEMDSLHSSPDKVLENRAVFVSDALCAGLVAGSMQGMVNNLMAKRQQHVQSLSSSSMSGIRSTAPQSSNFFTLFNSSAYHQHPTFAINTTAGPSITSSYRDVLSPKQHCPRDILILRSTSAAVMFASRSFFRRVLSGESVENAPNGMLQDQHQQNRRRQENHPFSLNSVMASALAGCTVGAFITPLNKMAASRGRYSNLMNKLKGGTFIGSSWNGMRLVCAREALGCVALFATYDGVKTNLMRHNSTVIAGDEKANTGHVLLSGGIAGVAHCLVTHPFRVLTSSPFAGHEVQGALMAEARGMGGLHRGFVSCAARSIPSYAVLFWGYEATLQYVSATAK